jgi:tetratricopeptide (TPR) repeat protein
LFSEALLSVDDASLEEVLSECDGLVGRFRGAAGDHESFLAHALLAKGLALERLDRREERLAAIEEALSFAEDNPEALMRRVGALVDLDRRSEALAALDQALPAVLAAEPDSQTWLVGLALEFMRSDAAGLHRIAATLETNTALLSAALMAWVQTLLPMSRLQAQKLEQAEATMRDVLGARPECEPILQILSAVRRDALGDRKALLEIPVEVRLPMLRLLGRDDDEAAVY